MSALKMGVIVRPLHYVEFQNNYQSNGLQLKKIKKVFLNVGSSMAEINCI